MLAFLRVERFHVITQFALDSPPFVLVPFREAVLEIPPGVWVEILRVDLFFDGIIGRLSDCLALLLEPFNAKVFLTGLKKATIVKLFILFILFPILPNERDVLESMKNGEDSPLCGYLAPFPL